MILISTEHMVPGMSCIILENGDHPPEAGTRRQVPCVTPSYLSFLSGKHPDESSLSKGGFILARGHIPVGELVVTN